MNEQNEVYWPAAGSTMATDHGEVVCSAVRGLAGIRFEADGDEDLVQE